MAALKDHNGMMTPNRDRFVMQDAWDRASKSYLERRGNDVSAVSYGNLAPSDDELGLLGDLRGKRVLDIGCGGGHNAVACALAGATVVGVDLSATQLAAAKQLAQEHGVAIAWQQSDGRSLGEWNGKPFDLILAIQALPYVDDAVGMLRLARQCLRLGGRLIASIDHPIRNCFYDTEMAELSPYPVRSYDDEEPLLWNFGPGLPMQTHHRPLGQWIGWVIEAGFVLQQVIEAAAPLELQDELWPEDSPLAPLRAIPHTAILVANVVENS